jgi:quinol monooxygenase YgiN
MQFARNVQFHVKSGKDKEFASLLEKEIVPTLRKQGGFKENFTLVNPGHAMTISIWNDRQSAETYNTSTYPTLVQKLNPVIEGTPKVETFEVATSTLRA